MADDAGGELDEVDLELAQIYAKLSLHEFLLENVYAQVAQGQPDPKAYLGDFTTKLDRLAKKPWSARSGADATAAMTSAVARFLTDQAKHFAEKVARRVASSSDAGER